MSDFIEEETISVPLASLGADILIQYLFRYLVCEELEALGATCKTLRQLVLSPSVWHDLYIRRFGLEDAIPPVLTDQWRMLYHWRTTAKPHAWGWAWPPGRLGLRSDQIPKENKGARESVCIPTLVPTQPLIKHIRMGGFATGALTVDDGFLATSELSDEPGFQKAPTASPIDPWDIVEMSMGRQGSAIRCADGSVYVWSADPRSTAVKVPNIGLEGVEVVKVISGWSACTLMITSDGNIIVAYAEDTPPYHQARNSLLGTKTIEFDSELPRSSVVDAMAGEGFIVYVDESGFLYHTAYTDLNSSTLSTSTKLTDFDTKLAEISNGKGKFTRISGCFRQFAAFSSTGHVIIGRKTNSGSVPVFEATVYEELQTDCLEIAMGDYHALALMKGGRLLAWGSESNQCGCFGMGGQDKVLAAGGVLTQSRGLNVDRPTKVPIDGYVLSVAAGGWQSAALIAHKLPRPLIQS